MARPKNPSKKDKRRLEIRKLTKNERKLLSKKLATKTLPHKLYVRYRIVDEMAKRIHAKHIATRCGVHLHTVYRVTDRFNRNGFQCFESPPNPRGRPPELSPEQITKLIKVALSKPKDLGLPFTQWSTAKLKAYCQKKDIYPEYSSEWLRRLLRREGVTFQRTKTWKESPDPEFESKKTVS